MLYIQLIIIAKFRLWHDYIGMSNMRDAHFAGDAFIINLCLFLSIVYCF